jgi:hypothetical protein
MIEILEHASPANLDDASSEYESKIEYLSFSELRQKYRDTHNTDDELQRCGVYTFRKDGQEITELTAYNAAQPVYDVHYDPDSGKPFFTLAVRMERRDDESESTVECFRAASAFSDVWDYVGDVGEKKFPVIKGQDPSITKIGKQLLLGVVEVQTVTDDSENSKQLIWNMAFYQGPSIPELQLIAKGPVGMKDVRPVEIPSGQIVTFTRPQNIGNEELGGLGQIGEITTDSFDEIKDPEVLQTAPLINTRFISGKQWGGINYGVALNDGRIGVIGHIAEFNNEDPEYLNSKDRPKIYSPFKGIYNRVSRQIEDVELLAEADEFRNRDGSPIIPKTPLLKDVAFGTAITEPDEDGNVRLILGVGDSVSCYKTIKDPFTSLRIPESELHQAS